MTPARPLWTRDAAVAATGGASRRDWAASGVSIDTRSLAPGDLWTGRPDSLVRHAGVLPPGPEDLALEAGTRMLWSLSEWPRRRWVFALDADVWPDEEGSSG